MILNNFITSLCFIVLKLLNDVSALNCNFDVKLTQTLLNEGFHRNITYGIVFNSDDDSDRWLYSDCIIGLDQTLPPGVFVNPDELNDLKRQNKVHAIPKNRVNVELPAEQSSTSNVFVVGLIRDDKASMWLPVHARYHQARPEGGMARNEIHHPKMYIRCPDQRLNECDKSIKPALSFLCNGSSKEKCSWKELPFTALTDILIWEVPVGNMRHYYLVASGTAAVIAIGSLYLLKIVHNYTMSRLKWQ